MKPLFIALVLAAALAAGAAAADPAGDRLVPCLGCHGEKGQSETADIPSLGALPAPYALIQLYMFREALRAAPPMNDLMKGTSDQDLQALADAIAALPPPAAATAGDPQRMAQGTALAEQYHCNVCHQTNFAGHDNVPRLAGQREDYLLKTLAAYKSGARRGYDATMAEALQPVADADLPILAYLIAHTR